MLEMNGISDFNTSSRILNSHLIPDFFTLNCSCCLCCRKMKTKAMIFGKQRNLVLASYSFKCYDIITHLNAYQFLNLSCVFWLRESFISFFFVIHPKTVAGLTNVIKRKVLFVQLFQHSITNCFESFESALYFSNEPRTAMSAPPMRLKIPRGEMVLLSGKLSFLQKLITHNSYHKKICERKGPTFFQKPNDGASQIFGFSLEKFNGLPNGENRTAFWNWLSQKFSASFGF